MVHQDLVEGQTAAVDAQLLNDGAAPDLTGCTLALELKGTDGAAVTTTVAFRDPAVATVRYSPGALDLSAAKSPYRARWKVTDALGKIAWWPNGEPEKWIVRKPTL